MSAVKRAFTIQEAAHYLGRSVSYVRKLMREDELIGRRSDPSNKRETLIFLLEDLDAYLDTLEVA